ncbi:FAD-dependent oxidoreductase [Pseudochrobactrum sp. sp1633]|uniref:NAD(P)/FAD-dependent oxidoreductase n=1 Tax=Pseudochrobactrum sp. sp1633 TaxID=3036706 RepID=UPI0025A557BE|nr:FAD-dependent oxidoreductase [Pseudochrobactrum sp. sp1633]MDM8347082.1 FAD-dependent oxidoreductase [Pseudochrobactrum sp. sp1633]HWD12611.1 FAD-dependent oxidoreductase [Pseudochrobactrum sp.]
MSKLTYPDYSNICGWNAMLPPRSPRPPLDGDVTVDYAVIGAGYTGLAVARRLRELRPDARIAVVEATTVGEGSSARNSGFTGTDVLPRNITVEMSEKARLQSQLFADAFAWLTDIIRNNNIQCDMQQVGAIRGAATERGEASVRSVLEVAKKLGVAHQELSRQDIADRIGTDYYRFGLYLADTWLLQPAALIRGLADALPADTELYENTPVERIEHQGDWILSTRSGQIRAKKIALANNGFIRRFGYLNSKMTTIYTYAAVTESVPEADRVHLGRDQSWGLLPSHRLGTTLRRIGSDRLMVRSLYAHEKELGQSFVEAELRNRFERRWPDLRHVKFEYVWGGTTALTMNGAPWWGKLEDGLYASGGCNGSGITKGTMLGRHLAELMCDAGDHAMLEQVMGQASFIAPEPFRSIGFRVISAIESRKAGLEI